MTHATTHKRPTTIPSGARTPRAERETAQATDVVLQRTARRNIRGHWRRDALRVSVLVSADLVVVVVVKNLVSLGLASRWIGGSAPLWWGRLLPGGWLGGWQFAAALLFALTAVRAYGTADQRRDVRGLFAASALAAGLSLYGLAWEHNLITVLVQFAAVTILFGTALTAARFVVDQIVRRIRPFIPSPRVVVVGGDDGWIDQWTSSSPSHGFSPSGFRVVGTVEPAGWLRETEGVPLKQLGAVVGEREADTVLVGGSLNAEDFAYVVEVALMSGCRLLTAPRTVGTAGIAMREVWVDGMPLVELTAPALHGQQLFVKRGIDLLGATLGLLLLSPVLALVAAAIKLDSLGPVLFSQERVGYAARVFRLLKFRTMREGADAEKEDMACLNRSGDPRLFKIPDDPRVTRLGMWLRRWSLDELPQLWNVLRGDMSLVGPRPFFEADLSDYLDHHFIRLGAKPGITGLWQVKGRSSLVDFEEVVALDREYVRLWSLWMDLKILFLTIPAVIRRTGAY